MGLLSFFDVRESEQWYQPGEEFTVDAKDQNLGLARRIGTDHLDTRRLAELIFRDAIKKRHGARSANAQLSELFDVMFDRGHVSSGPAGDNERMDIGDNRFGAILRIDNE